MSQVKDVVFDVGRVLIDFSYERLIEVLSRQGSTVSTVDEFTTRVDLGPYEHGEISDRQFLQNLNALLREPLPERELSDAWKDLFTPIDQMLQLAARLKLHCGVYLISNTSNMHWQHLLQTYRLADVCHGHLASYQVGVMKPAPQIFSIASERFKLTPGQTVFVDDMKVNVDGAIACGWQGIHHQDIAETRRLLMELTGFSL
ncbi:MAG: HAD family phosphatase [Desulfuromonadales bacterium]|jgi:putative hydrolase of the HAD superfamily|nr:HAD family phosphatase [Desulfuromonadales bacterium]